jgi:predicted transcriptional regulator
MASSAGDRRKPASLTLREYKAAPGPGEAPRPAADPQAAGWTGKHKRRNGEGLYSLQSGGPDPRVALDLELIRVNRYDADGFTMIEDRSSATQCVLLTRAGLTIWSAGNSMRPACRLLPPDSAVPRRRFAMTTKVLTAHVPLSLAEKVDQLAARLERSRGWIIKQALSAWVEQEEERRRLTLEALADVDAGCVIDHQAVQAWAASLDTGKPLPAPR